MTASEIWQAARLLNPHIQLRDVWFILGQLQERNLVTCLTPKLVTGKVHCLTDLGRKVVAQCLSVPPALPVPSIRWKHYGYVVRGQMRKRVLLEFLRHEVGAAITASALRRRMLDSHPAGLNPTLRALKELTALDLVRLQEAPDGKPSKGYAITPHGHHLVSVGTLDTLLVHPREVFRVAIIAGGTSAIVLMHNHPSGDATPSEGDIKVTRDLIRAGQILRIDVVDHVIIGANQHASLRTLGYFFQ